MESVQSGKPLVLVSLLPHEQKVLPSRSLHLRHSKTDCMALSLQMSPGSLFFICEQMSVMHVLVRRHPSNTEPIKSKEELVFHCGFRRFRACPTFSQHTAGRTSVNQAISHLSTPNFNCDFFLNQTVLFKITLINAAQDLRAMNYPAAP